MTFSMDHIFIAVTLGCVLFFLQILMDYNRQASKIRPQIRHVEAIQARHTEELEKVERMIRETEQEQSTLNTELERMEQKITELESTKARLQAMLDAEET